MKSQLLFILTFLFFNSQLFSQDLCTDTTKLHKFDYDGKSYAIVKDSMNWIDAKACAYQLGGFLARIDNGEEQNAIWSEIPEAGIVNSNTVASDGGQGSYIWLGGNDIGEEGKWEWINESDVGLPVQFWQGTSTGNPIGNLYNNWGSGVPNWGAEPDDYLGNQDALGLALTDWPLGSAGQWNDLNHQNLLYFIIEMQADTSTGGSGDTTNTGDGSDTTSVWNYSLEDKIAIYPNPASEYFQINSLDINKVSVINALGQNVLQQKVVNSSKVNVAELKEGFYFIILQKYNGKQLVEKIRIY